MQSRDFCFWLQGLLEVGDPQALTLEQIRKIRYHLNLVFTHEIDPTMPDPTGTLAAAHEGKLPPYMDSNTKYPPGERPRC